MTAVITAGPGGSTRPHARAAAGLYLVSGIFNGFSVFVLLRLVVPNDPAATASNVLGSEAMFRLGFVADIVSVGFVVATTVIFYRLFRPVDRTVALIATVIGLMASTIQALSSFSNLASLLLLERAGGLASFTTAQAQALALMFLQLHGLVFSIAVLFFGVSWALFGYLVFRSAFLPRLIGVLVVVDGWGYVAASLAKFLTPALVPRLYPYLPVVPVILGEGSRMVWLLVKGIDEQRWVEQGGRL